MGYTTEFEGEIKIDPPLSEAERRYLHKFSNTRRMLRREGPYFIGGSGSRGQGHDPDVIAYNDPPMGQPRLWCNWEPSEDGTSLIWNGAENFYYSAEWMLYFIQHFLSFGALAVNQVPGIVGGHILNGTIEAQGEDADDKWILSVADNVVYIKGKGRRNILHTDGHRRTEPNGKKRVRPANYVLELSNDRVRAYAQELFGLVRDPSRCEGLVIPVDPDTGAPGDLIEIYRGGEIIDSYRIGKDGKAYRHGVLDWSPE